MSKKKGKAGKPAAAEAKKPEAAETKKVKGPKAEETVESKVSSAELDALREAVEEGKEKLDQARDLAAQAKDDLRAGIVQYREACRKAGVECEYEGGRSANVSEKVSFIVEKTEKGVRVMVKGQPKTEEVIPLAALKESINKAAYGYTEKHLGPRREIGNEGGSFSNRLRSVMA